VYLTLDATDKRDPFVSMRFDQMAQRGAHSLDIIRDEHGGAFHLHRLGYDGQIAI